MTHLSVSEIHRTSVPVCLKNCSVPNKQTTKHHSLLIYVPIFLYDLSGMASALSHSNSVGPSAVGGDRGPVAVAETEGPEPADTLEELLLVHHHSVLEAM